ncbi:MAG: tetratricopeptide repeat protein [Mucilaginibacter sp.]|uniref:tetratricopeptide repeat protein n=1 Tax=Mucilaginibacter sp. TaxID=1882438 RepID=UPI003263802B
MMKRITYLVLLLALPFTSFGNDEVNTLFAKGNDQYAKGKYADAAKTYQSILNNGNQSATVYFNLGNAYYKQGDIPSAILYYEKAHKINPGDDDINFNIQLCNLKTTDKIDPTPDIFLTKWWEAIVMAFSVGTLGWLSILFFIAGSGVFIAYLYSQSVSLKRTSFFTAMGLISIGLITIILAATQVHYFASHKQAIVFSNAVNVKSEPGAGSKNLFVIHEGTKVDVLENSNNWMRVRLLNGNEGWILVGDVKAI